MRQCAAGAPGMNLADSILLIRTVRRNILKIDKEVKNAAGIN
jgi:hypothetical protein